MTDEDAERTPQPKRAIRRPLVVVASVVAVALVAGAIVWLTRDDRPRVAVGEVVEPQDGAPVAGVAVDVLLPVGRIRVSIGEPREELPSRCCADRPADVRAPKGGSFVGVEVAGDELDRRFPTLVPLGETLPVPRFTLLVGPTYEPEQQRRYPLGPLGEWPESGTSAGIAGRAVYVAIEERPDREDVAVEVEYDGVVQVAEADGFLDRGDANGLYLLDRDEDPVRCGRASGPDGFGIDDVGECTLGIHSRHFVAGLGWAAPGRTWLAVRAEVVSELVSFVRREAGRRVEYEGGSGVGPELRVRLLNRPSAAAVFPVETYSEAGVLAVFEVAEQSVYDARIVVHATYADVESDRTGRELPDATVTWQQRG